jgi:hypothetical protein
MNALAALVALFPFAAVQGSTEIVAFEKTMSAIPDWVNSRAAQQSLLESQKFMNTRN